MADPTPNLACKSHSAASASLAFISHSFSAVEIIDGICGPILGHHEALLHRSDLLCFRATETREGGRDFRRGNIGFMSCLGSSHSSVELASFFLLISVPSDTAVPSHILRLTPSRNRRGMRYFSDDERRWRYLLYLYRNVHLSVCSWTPWVTSVVRAAATPSTGVPARSDAALWMWMGIRSHCLSMNMACTAPGGGWMRGGM